jgi:hypothetical protein
LTALASKEYVREAIATVVGVTEQGDLTLANLTVDGSLNVTGTAAFTTVTVQDPVGPVDVVNRRFLTQAVRAGSGVFYATPADNANVVIPPDKEIVVLNPDGPLPGITITLPATPVDGAVTTITSTQDVSGLSFNNGPFLFGGQPGLSAHNAFTVVYSAAAASYFVI